MDMDSGAGLLHRLTSYVPDREWDEAVDDPRMRRDLVPNDVSILPPPVKSYPGDLAVIRLPRELPSPQIAATEVLAGRSEAIEALDIAHLGRIMFLGAGVVRTSVYRVGKMMFRAAGSAGGRFPLELYASTRDVNGVPDGVHWYDPVDHALVRVGPPASGVGTTLVVTGIPWRTAWRYSERGWRHLYWDGGTLLAQLIAAAGSVGLKPALRTLFPDDDIASLVGADGVHECPLALLTLGLGAPAAAPGGPAVTGSLDEVELPLCTLAQEAGRRDELGDPWPEGPVLEDTPPSESLDEVVLRRGSQRLMDRKRTLSRQILEWSMSAAMRGIDVPHWVAVHGVDDTPPGIYRWPDLTAPLRAGSWRDELLRICLDQALAADAAFVVIGAISPDGLDDRSYRDAQLAAGIVEGRLHLAAYALGASASGMTFIDSEVPALLGEPEDLITLLFTCVGVPEYRSRPGGRPGAPVSVTSVHPRLGS